MSRRGRARFRHATPGSVHSALIHVNVSKKTWTATETWNLKSKNRILWGCLGMSSYLIQKTLARGEIRCVFGLPDEFASGTFSFCWKRTPLSVAVDMVGAGWNLFGHAPGVSKNKRHHQKKRFPADIDCGHSQLLTPFRRIFDGPDTPCPRSQCSALRTLCKPTHLCKYTRLYWCIPVWVDIQPNSSMLLCYT